MFKIAEARHLEVTLDDFLTCCITSLSVLPLKSCQRMTASHHRCCPCLVLPAAFTHLAASQPRRQTTPTPQDLTGLPSHHSLPTRPVLTTPALSAAGSCSVSPLRQPQDLLVPPLEAVFLQLSVWLAPVPPPDSSPQVALLRTSPTNDCKFYPHPLPPLLCFLLPHSACHLPASRVDLSDYPSSRM